MRKSLLATVCASVTLAGESYLSATPAEAAGEPNRQFSCTNEFQQVTSMNCECV